MHHVYTRRIVIALVVFFAVLAVVFGNLVVSLRDQFASAQSAGSEAAQGAEGAFVLPDGEATFNNYCSSCHQAQAFADKLAGSMDADAASRAHLEKLIGPPAHGGVSPAEALSVVIAFRTLAGLPSTYPESVPTPAAAATAAAAEPTPTQIPVAQISQAEAEAVFSQYCSICHNPQSFVTKLQSVPDPDVRSKIAIDFLGDSAEHSALPNEVFRPAINYIRILAGFAPLN